ncbi:MAG: LysR family transcriptional regulator [Alphaproteobacteria bacterium]|nr:LysR family transcriptional regulator [Alphaproteobacteria bacterium]MBU1514003.1 LysR family transcriptional regulator [Alphaproteobacteria bacterium]MBU2093057.1 LysR family transcriptional regulator [Alphaproteobacteria bacterium]MBU2151740.1 LysR family transcriptional regulator [Alphaproteobacteria bacterium]MBU2309440.1 LysR family transcriptional regulator [Alphaproteobacteria bacterium]
MSDPLANIALSAIRVFETAARLGSFTRAAQELGMTQAAVSWHVKALEKRLDQPLFRRLPREVALTPAGERLARAATEAMGALRSAIGDITDSGTGVLSITVLQTFAALWLAPRLGAFQIDHPEIAVRLDSAQRLADLMREEFDVGIRVSDKGEWPGLESIFLFPATQTVLVTPQVLAALGPHPRPEDLLKVDCVGSDPEWNGWYAKAGVVRLSAEAGGRPRIAADTQVLEVATAMSNGAAAIGSPVMFGADIAAGRLSQPFEIYIGEGGGYWLAYPQDRRRTRKIAAFREWLLDQVQADPAAQRQLARRAAASKV